MKDTDERQRGFDLLRSFDMHRDQCWIPLSLEEYKQKLRELPKKFQLTGSSDSPGGFTIQSWMIRHVPGQLAIMRHFHDDTGFSWWLEKTK